MRRVVARVAAHPGAGSPLDGGRRRWLLDGFPLAVVYPVLRDGSVRVLAVAHHRRRPGYWAARR